MFCGTTGNHRCSSSFLWMLAALGFLTLRESYLAIFGKPYVPPILKPSALEFALSAADRDAAFAKVSPSPSSSAAASTTTAPAAAAAKKRNNTNAPPDWDFTITNEERMAALSSTSNDEFLSVVMGSSRDHRLPWCSREQIINGTWVVDRRDKPPYVTPTTHLRCYPKEKYVETPWESWRWLPADKKTRRCDFHPWAEKDFCSLLPRATFAIVGDSLSWEHYSSLVQTHGLKIHQGFQHQSKELYTNVVHSVCGGQTKVLYRRDDRLLNLTAAIDQHFPTVLVLNRGAHYATDRILLSEIRKNIQEVREWLARCDAMKIKCHFFWRTTVPGHPGCGNFTRPINNLAAMEAHVGNLNLYDEYTINYHWYDFQRQNELVLDEFRQARLNSFEVVDAYYLNILRPDEHRHHQGDCLHNCYPGKMDVYNDIVLHYLRMQRTDIDIERLVTVANERGWSVNENTEYDPEATEEAKFFRVGHRDYERLFHEEEYDGA